MKEAEAKEVVTFSLSRNVFRDLELFAVATQLDFDAVIEAALDEYFSVIERCDPDVRALVRVLEPPPPERHQL